MGHPLVADGVAERQHHVVLAPHLPEFGRTEPPIQRLVGDVLRCIGHVEGAYRPPSSEFPVRTRPSVGVRLGSATPGDRHRLGPRVERPDALCDGQVGCGTRPDLLRAAAFRP